jgi:hypothetical protein
MWRILAMSNWGRLVEVQFDYPITGIEGQAGQFKIIDGNNVQYAGQSIEYVGVDNKRIRIRYTDFNAAYGSQCILRYTPGTIQGPATALATFDFTFTPINLVPPAPAAPLSVSNSNSLTILVEFNGNVTSADWAVTKSAFSVTGFEYNYVPGGALQAKTYTISSVGYADGTGANKKLIAVTLTAAGRLKAPQGNVTVAYNQATGNLMSAGGAIVSFGLAFAPTGLTPVYAGVNDIEKIEITNITATGSLLTVTYSNTKEDEKIEITNVTATGTLTHINDL